MLCSICVNPGKARDCANATLAFIRCLEIVQICPDISMKEADDMRKESQVLRLGIDVGSTTAKVVVLNPQQKTSCSPGTSGTTRNRQRLSAG